MTASTPPTATTPTLAPARAAAPSAAPAPASGTVLVLGATGKTGRRVADRLDAAGVPVRRASRSGDVRFDWDDDTTWGPALAGAAAVYVAYAPDLAVPGAPETVARLAARAHDAGVHRLVLLSGRGEEEAQRAEELVGAAFPARTVVRCAFFDQNFSESFLLEPVLDGVLALPVDQVAEPFVDLEDVADVAVAALTGDALAGRVLELTGPRALTFREAVAEIAAASGHDVRYEPVGMDAFVAGLAAAGLPDDVVDLMRYLFTEVLDGRGTPVTDGVRAALGREPRDFREFASREAGAWASGSSAGTRTAETTP
ncbi:NmrA family transcriptional regulator [Cellulosimicrobium sp. TH-20]|uniref:NmrA family transcriptional regulator n=1 Tax=Cellulosimicrobium sp. TH-20 TaxID=1980001 RepID=UPI001C9A162F